MKSCHAFEQNVGLKNAPFKNNRATIDRRRWIQNSIAGVVSATTFPFLNNIMSKGEVANAAAVKKEESKEEMIQPILDSQEMLTKLLDNWDKATIDCTYADVPRELLEAKNKELLLEKAKTSALFDKSASVTSCKTNNKIVRDYLGVTGKGPLVNIDKKLKKAFVVIDDVDQLDDYVQEIETFSQLISKASSLSYAAGVADFDAVNNFDKDDESRNSSSTSNLGQTRTTISEAKTSLDRIVVILTN